MDEPLGAFDRHLREQLKFEIKYTPGKRYPPRHIQPAIRPPVIGCGTPVVLGKLIGKPRRARTARKAKHSASTASPRQPILSAETA